MLAVLGSAQLASYTEILNALNPYYAYDFLTHYPKGFILLGAVFLCTTGAEALYSDLGHCGIKNIRISWIFVKNKPGVKLSRSGSLVDEPPSTGC